MAAPHAVRRISSIISIRINARQLPAGFSNVAPNSWNQHGPVSLTVFQPFGENHSRKTIQYLITGVHKANHHPTCRQHYINPYHRVLYLMEIVVAFLFLFPIPSSNIANNKSLQVDAHGPDSLLFLDNWAMSTPECMLHFNLNP